ncbi:hypothetical protein MXM17_09580 [Staphylococcus xylosus]|uniref:DUF6941 family protein n=1 Tax=Staphylococcus xylosus TaxID=1288 RepID=UPI002DBE51A4|nr:hypothetical protein [Staphylococcus xylosus]MEB6323752.1 hypothetical protein [Staphylococcus xylosus]
MARIAWIVPSREVFNDENGHLLIGSPFTQLTFNGLPSSGDFSISFGVIGINFTEKNTAYLEIGYENIEKDIKEILIEAEVPIEIVPDNEIVETDENGLTQKVFSITINDFDFKICGIYYVRINIDGNVQTNYFQISNTGGYKNE